MNKEWIFSLDQINEVASDLALLLGEGSKIFLTGDMAAGKTTFTKALVLALGSNNEVTSPTYSLVNEYEMDKAPYLIRHLDLYRINSIEETLDFGIEDYLYDDSICIIEWPEIIEDIAPENVFRLNLNVLPNNHRKLVFL